MGWLLAEDQRTLTSTPRVGGLAQRGQGFGWRIGRDDQQLLAGQVDEAHEKGVECRAGLVARRAAVLQAHRDVAQALGNPGKKVLESNWSA